VLKAMEEAGRIRRGWFVDGLSGAQFALPGAIDRLRARRDQQRGGEVVALPAVDPANAYGALLPWPERAGDDAGRARRVPGAFVGLLDGRLVWYLLPGRRRLLLFPEALQGEPQRLPQALRALHGLPRAGRRLLVLDRVDGVAARESPQLEAFLAAGFVPDYRGLIADPARGERPAPRRWEGG